MGNVLVKDCQLPENPDEVWQIFSQAVDNDNIPLVQNILSQLDGNRKLDFLTKPDGNGNSVVHKSVIVQSRMLNTLLDQLNVDERFVVLSKSNHCLQTPLHHATVKHASNAAETILSSINKENRLELLLMKDSFGLTALHIAANRVSSRVMDSKIFQTLVDSHAKEANSNDYASLYGTLDSNNQTPLHLACLSGNLDVAIFILERMSECIPQNVYYLLLNALSSSSANSPVHLAADYGLYDIIDLMKDSLDKKQWFTLLRKGNSRKSTPLHLAASSGKHDTVSIICNSVNYQQFCTLLSLKDEYQSTPLNIAFELGQMEVVNVIKNTLSKMDWLNTVEALHGEHRNRKAQLRKLGASESILQSIEQGYSRMLDSIVHTEVDLVMETDDTEG